MTDKIIKLASLSQPYVLPNGKVFQTKKELEAYIEGIRNAMSNINNFVENMVLSNAIASLNRENNS